jgi:hypothetical protein
MKNPHVFGVGIFVWLHEKARVRKRVLTGHNLYNLKLSGEINRHYIKYLLVKI